MAAVPPGQTGAKDLELTEEGTYVSCKGRESQFNWVVFDLPCEDHNVFVFEVLSLPKSIDGKMCLCSASGRLQIQSNGKTPEAAHVFGLTGNSGSENNFGWNKGNSTSRLPFDRVWSSPKARGEEPCFAHLRVQDDELRVFVNNTPDSPPPEEFLFLQKVDPSKGPWYPCIGLYYGGAAIRFVRAEDGHVMVKAAR
mmetsp:Transcript_64805/g.153205  ORF Transcript_64805/g.153205 Transcript_64805/m.153205 type:complete len:196 (+) Transcript_64805:1-588(+)